MALLKQLLGITEDHDICLGEGCLSESEANYIDAMSESERGMARAEQSTQSQQSHAAPPSWEELLRVQERR
jgi:hypothetical protein